MNWLENHLKTRRENWPYEGRYRLEQFKESGFVAKVDDEVAGFIWSEDITPKEVRIKMNLKAKYAEYAIGTELLETLVTQLKTNGYCRIYYTIIPEHYAYQIYRHLGFAVTHQDEERIAFIWEKA